MPVTWVNNEIHHHYDNNKQSGNLHIEHKVKKLDSMKTRHQVTEILNISHSLIFRNVKPSNLSVENSENLLFNHTANCDVTKP